MTQVVTIPPSEKQLNYIEVLRAQRVGAGAFYGVIPKSSQEASKLIGQLLELPRVIIEQFVTQDGMYKDPSTGDIYKVQRNKAQGDGSRLYAKRLVITSLPQLDDDGAIITSAKIKFEYIAGLMMKIRPSWKMTLEDAEEFGALYGVCIRCGRTLTNEDSIERALGPICAGYF